MRFSHTRNDSSQILTASGKWLQSAEVNGQEELRQANQPGKGPKQAKTEPGGPRKVLPTHNSPRSAVGRFLQTLKNSANQIQTQIFHAATSSTTQMSN